jgi:fermentation-respiration switch protein FrsA (DUF1100 family)
MNKCLVSAKCTLLALIVFAGGAVAAQSSTLRDQLDVTVMMYDYRGYGRSEGTPSEEGTYADIRGAYRHVRSRGFEPASIVLMGQSLGTAITVDLAASEKVGAVILEAPFTSVPAVAHRLFWPLPVGWLVSTKYDSLAKISRIQSPVAIVHATGDSVIAYDLGRKLFEAARPPKEFFGIRADRHEGALMELGSEELRRLKQFLFAADSSG